MTAQQINTVITNPDYKGDECAVCTKPIYQTTVGEKKELQWIHIFTGCAYCNSIFTERSGLATPKVKENFATDHLPEGSH